MLQLRSQGAYRVRAFYTCSLCLAGSRTTRYLAHRPTFIPSHYGRPLSITSCRPAPTTESSTPSSDGIEDIGLSTEVMPKKKKKKKPKKTNAEIKVPPISKQAASQIDSERQLQVLQGALQALKNVLAAQNIRVDQFGRPSNQADDEKPKPSTSVKTKSRSKSNRKNAKASHDDASQQHDAENSRGEKLEDGKDVAAADTTSNIEPESLSSTSVAVKPSLRRILSKREANRAKSKAKAAQPKSDEDLPPGDASLELVLPEPADESSPPAEALFETPAPPKSADESSPPVKASFRKVLNGKNGANNGAIYAALRESLRNLAAHGINELPSRASIIRSVSRRLRSNQIISKPATSAKRPSPRRIQLSKLKDNILQRPKEEDRAGGDNAPLAINTLDATDLHLTTIEADRPPVPSLSYGLDRVLFNPGVYYLQDPRSRVYNFDPYLSKIMPIQEFDFNALKQYVTSSKDMNLIRIAKEHKKKYTGSTSSMTSMLAHFHYLLSSWREINTSMLSRAFQPDSVRFTRIMTGPAAVFLHWKDGTYAIDADKEFDTANILSMLGKSMEKLLTLPKEDYERYRHVNSDQITEEERNADEAFHYTGFRDFMMRSQLDAYDPRVPRSGMFDLKTRAVVSIRMDAKEFHKGLGYEIRNRFGQWQSFEREYYDMIRSAFLKYSLQVRMGRMDGIFVAFHNTQRIFGFQYISLNEMDFALHGTYDPKLGNTEYKYSLSLLNDVLDRASKRFPEQSLRLHFETRTSVSAPFMYIFAKPVSQTDIEEVQSSSKASIEAFEKEMLGIVKDGAEADAEPEAEVESTGEHDEAVDEEEETEEPSILQEMSSLAAWKEVRQMVEDAVDDDEGGIGAVREAIEDALEQSGLLQARSSAEARRYVDALLSAITSSTPSKAAESVEISGEEGIEAGQDDASLLVRGTLEPEQESPSDEPSTASDDAYVEQSQVIDHSIETSTKTSSGDGQPGESSDLNDDKQSTQLDAVTETNGEAVGTIGPLEDQMRPVDEVVDSTSPEQTHMSERNVEDRIDETSEARPAMVTEQDINGQEKLESDTHKSTTSDNEQGSVEVGSDSTVFVDTLGSQEQANMSKSKEEEVEEDDEIDEDEDETDDVEDELQAEESKRDSNATPSMSPLKDLIVKMAQRIDEGAASDEADSSIDDSSKLKEFERILGELIASSKDQQTHQTKDASPTQTTQTNAGTQDHTEPAESETKEADAQESSELPPSGATTEASQTASEATEDEDDTEVLGMILTIKNKLNGKYVTRPNELKPSDQWQVEYNLSEIAANRTRTLYQQCLRRRQKVFQDPGDRDSQWYNMFRGKLNEHTNSGRKFRARETASAKKYPVYVYGTEGGQPWEDVFGESALGGEKSEDKEADP
ncbi:Pet127-domain-containing protein [Hypoxylon sp. NC1633]|nr:Pet127-domain-containing protein [Hypoxylon sp. NC1633]